MTHCTALKWSKDIRYLFRLDYNYPVSLSALDYVDFTPIMALYKLYYLLTYIIKSVLSPQMHQMCLVTPTGKQTADPQAGA